MCTEWRKGFLQLLLLKVCELFFWDRVTKRVAYCDLFEFSLHFLAFQGKNTKSEVGHVMYTVYESHI